MNEIEGNVFNIADSNPIIIGCTVSKQVLNTDILGIFYFSLAQNTDISAETYNYYKLLKVEQGEIEVYSINGNSIIVNEGDSIVTAINIPVGIRTKYGAIFTEINFIKEAEMNATLKAGEVLSLKDLLPYQEDKIVNMDIAHNDKMKFILMSFGAGTGLAEHSAPGDALIFALDGEGIIGYEGREHKIKAGENFKFAKNGKHYVKAKTNFKMALLLTLE